MDHEPWDRLAASLRLPSPMEPLSDACLPDNNVQVFLKRDDLIHADVPGNKWRKLKHNITEAAATGHSSLLTFGGAYSNHIRATAAAGYYCGMSTIGLIRGEEHLPLNPSLAYAVQHGMRLSYMDRGRYRQKTDPELITALRQEFGPFYLLPEGGSNELGVRGCSEIPDEIEMGFDVICCPCGTGGTLAGIALSLKPEQRAIGFSALRGGEFLAGEVADLQRRVSGRCLRNWHIEYDFYFGGFAKKTRELELFIRNFRDRHGVELEWVYVAKMMYGLYTLIEDRYFDPGTRIVAVITGPPSPTGLQKAAP